MKITLQKNWFKELVENLFAIMHVCVIIELFLFFFLKNIQSDYQPHRWGAWVVGFLIVLMSVLSIFEFKRDVKSDSKKGPFVRDCK